LLGICRDGEPVYPDHDDDVATFLTNKDLVHRKAYPMLKRRGFQAIRNNDDFFSVIRNNRYIDICFFRKNGEKIGYTGKWFPEHYFKQFSSVPYAGRNYPVPHPADALLREMYPQERPVKQKSVPLSREEFLNCKIEDDNSINWTLRAPHLNAITENGKITKVVDIIDCFSNPNKIEALKDAWIVETDTSRPFSDPINLCEPFWQTGNNFFFYSIYYGFRKNVLPYMKANEYIKQGTTPLLYTGDYYECLEPMSYKEIETFLAEKPIVVENGCITHGQHRACAMIGLLAAGNEYVPLYKAA
jgi:hypothetical protein